MRRKGVVGKMGKKTPIAPKPSENVPPISKNALNNFCFPVLE